MLCLVYAYMCLLFVTIEKPYSSLVGRCMLIPAIRLENRLKENCSMNMIIHAVPIWLV